MKFWDVDKVAQDLRDKVMSEWDKTKYYIATLFLQLILLSITGLLFGYGANSYTIIAFAVSALVSYFSIVSVYKSCEKNQEISVIEALIVIGFPATVKSQTAYWAVYVVLLSGYYSAFITASIFTWIFIALTPAYYALFFSLVKQGVEKANV